MLVFYLYFIQLDTILYIYIYIYKYIYIYIYIFHAPIKTILYIVLYKGFVSFWSRFGSFRVVLRQFRFSFGLFWLVLGCFASVQVSYCIVLGSFGPFWLVISHFGSFYVSFWIVLGCLRSFWLLLGYFSSFQLVLGCSRSV